MGVKYAVPGILQCLTVITTHTTFISADFQATIARLNGPSLIIADEAHHLGAERSRQNYPQQIPYRLALSNCTKFNLLAE